jgi:hypothetical protein
VDGPDSRVSPRRFFGGESGEGFSRSFGKIFAGRRIPYVAGPVSATGVIHISRAYGRVDLTDGLEKFMIFRVKKDPENRWTIIKQDGFQIQEFDQQAFEQALKALLE